MENRMGEDIKRHIISEGPALERISRVLNGEGISMVHLTEQDRQRLAEMEVDGSDLVHRTIEAMHESKALEKKAADDEKWFFGIF
jgi:hypothetical protein